MLILQSVCFKTWDYKFISKKRDRFKFNTVAEKACETSEYSFSHSLRLKFFSTEVFQTFCCLFHLPPSYNIPFFHLPSPSFLHLSAFCPLLLFFVYFWRKWNLPTILTILQYAFYLVLSQSWGTQLFKTEKMSQSSYIHAGGSTAYETCSLLHFEKEDMLSNRNRYKIMNSKLSSEPWKGPLQERGPQVSLAPQQICHCIHI